METTDILVIGGGIVGLATAWAVQRRFPKATVLLLEKEAELAQHQTGHNSGVLHSGIYYKPGSLKACNCRAGSAAMRRFCEEYGIAIDICGKVIVAVDDSELEALAEIHRRGVANGVGCEIISREQLRELEPHANGIRAIHVPKTGIVDFVQVSRSLRELVEKSSRGRVMCGQKVTCVEHTDDGVRVSTGQGDDFQAGVVINCAGLYCDHVAKLSGDDLGVCIIPFRGEYYDLKPEAQYLCRNLIYPVPDPGFPFLGVHFTRMIGGGVECGPNAVLGLAREGYKKTDVNLHELAESLTYPGFLRLAVKYWRTGACEMWRSLSKRAFVRALQRLVPEICAEHLIPAEAGVRAQAVARDGSMVDDFLIRSTGRVINVGNAPSPAATSALTIGDTIAAMVENRFLAPSKIGSR